MTDTHSPAPPIRVRVNGEMVVLARQREGMTQAELAKITGISPSLLSRVESGVAQALPKPMVDLIADVTKVAASFFDREPKVRHLGFHRLYRLQRKVGTRALDKLEGELNARRMHMLHFLRTVDLAPSLPLPDSRDLDGFSPEQAAVFIRQQWLMGVQRVAGPITPLLEAAGILVVEVASAERAFEGLAVHAFGGCPIIFVRKDQSNDRRRFTLAHELAHLSLHAESTVDQESEANRFAAEFIMPEQVARQLLAGFSLQRALQIKAAHQVSVQFQIMRAEQIGYIDKEMKTKLYKQISARGWRTEEPLSEPAERPEMLARILNTLVRELDYKPEEIAEELGELPSRIIEYYFQELQPKLRLVSSKGRMTSMG